MKNKIYLNKYYVSFMLWLWDKREKINVFLHCNRGHHRVISESMSIKNHKGFHVRSSWIRCLNCNYKFFPSPHYRRNYKRLMDHKNSVNESVLAEMKKYMKLRSKPKSVLVNVDTED